MPAGQQALLSAPQAMHVAVVEPPGHPVPGAVHPPQAVAVAPEQFSDRIIGQHGCPAPPHVPQLPPEQVPRTPPQGCPAATHVAFTQQPPARQVSAWQQP
jgi:hypothetical protein